MTDSFSPQQTKETIKANADLFEALHFKMTKEKTDKAIADYFAEKAAKAARWEAKEKEAGR